MGVGTSFHIYLPVIPEALSTLPAEVAVSSTATESSQNEAAVQSSVIERNPNVQTIVCGVHIAAAVAKNNEIYAMVDV